MDFTKYQHVERFGRETVQGIEKGTCWVFPKIDGSNGSVWAGDNGAVRVGGRNRELSAEETNQGLYTKIVSDPRYAAYLAKHPQHILYGEWLVPHTLRNYRKDAWRKFYIFDVMENGVYLPYEKYQPLLEEFGLDYIPLIKSFKNGGYEELTGCLKENKFLVDSGDGEGIVIKNYDYRNRQGRQVWAKIIGAEFAEKHGSAGAEVTTEQKILDEYVTSAFIEKEYAKLTAENGWQPRMIPQLFNTVFRVLVEEEMMNIIGSCKYPTINFRTLNYLIGEKIKAIKPELFQHK